MPKSRSVLINWNLAGRFVGNAFMHSASVTFLSGYFKWKNVGQHRRVGGLPLKCTAFGFYHQMGAVQNWNQAAGENPALRCIPFFHTTITSPNWNLSACFVGNAFMHSALVANHQGVLNRKNVFLRRERIYAFRPFR